MSKWRTRARISHPSAAAASHLHGLARDLSLRALGVASATPALPSVEIARHPAHLRGLATRPGEKCRLGGFSLPSAVFILVILSLAGSFALRVSGVQRNTVALVLLQARAQEGARSGLEWAIFEALDNPAVCPSDTFTLGEGGLVGIDVTITCSSSAHEEAGTPHTVFQIQSTGEYGNFGDRDYAARTFRVVVVVP